MFGANQQPPHRTPQKWQILGQQQQAERQHPQSEDRQDAQNAAGDEKHPGRNAYPARRRFSQPSQKPADRPRQLLLDALELAIEFFFVFSGHGPSRRAEDRVGRV